MYGRAEPLYQRALAIREAALGKQPPDVATSLNNLAILYSAQGCTPGPSRSTSARSPFGKRPSASTIPTSPHRSTTSPASTRTGVVRPGRATLPARARHSGSGPRQETPRRRRLAQQPRQPLLWTRGCTARPSRSTSARSPSGKRPSASTIPTSPNRSTTSPTSTAAGVVGRAEPSLYQRALAIQEAALGKHHPNVARSLISLANPLHGRRGCTRRPSRSTSARSPSRKRPSASTIRTWIKIVRRFARAHGGGIDGQIVRSDPVNNAVAAPHPVLRIIHFAEIETMLQHCRLIGATVELLRIGEQSVQVKNNTRDHHCGRPCTIEN